MDSLVVMEATGYYHYRLAQFLYKNAVVVSVVKPLSVNRFIQMKLAKVKTDKSDAKAICDYALVNEVPIYNALTDVQSECLQLFRALDIYSKHRTATKNKMHGEEVLGIPSKFVYRSLRRNKKHLNAEIKTLEAKTFLSQRRPTTTAILIDICCWNRSKNCVIFNNCNRWFFNV
jgi:transposase